MSPIQYHKSHLCTGATRLLLSPYSVARRPRKAAWGELVIGAVSKKGACIYVSQVYLQLWLREKGCNAPQNTHQQISSIRLISGNTVPSCKS